MEQTISKEDIIAAHERIAPFIHRTPLLHSSTIDMLCGCEVHFKCENFQKIGAFKIRGATNAILKLSEKERELGVATHSSGNHAQAVAKAARDLGIPAYIVMPRTAPPVKIAAVKGYGGIVITCEPNQLARESTLDGLVKETGATIIHPYDNYDVIAGQGSAIKEVFEDEAEFDAVFTPVGGGGLLAGTALTTHYLSPHTKVYAGEPEGADDAFRSLKAGSIQPSENPDTIADGLLTSLGQRNFPIIQEHVAAIFTVSEQEIINAMRLIYERMKIVIEPSCAVPLAALLKEKGRFEGQKVAIILTGGNVSLDKLPF